MSPSTLRMRTRIEIPSSFWQECYRRLSWLCKEAPHYPLLCSLPLLAPWHWSNFCQVISEWKTYFKRRQMQSVEEERKEFFCQVHMLKQLKGSVNYEGQNGQGRGNIPLGTGQPGFVSSIFAPNYITLALLQDCTVKVLLNLMINKNMTCKAEFGQLNISPTTVSTTW